MLLSCCYGKEITEGSNGLVMDVELQRQKVQTAFLGAEPRQQLHERMNNREG
jgi:hypothetical protein